MENLILGVVSGVVSALLVWFFVLIFNKLIRPFISELLYRGVNLEGEWYGECFEFSENIQEKKTKKHKEFTITINQSAYRLDGKIIIKNINKNNEETYLSFYQHTGFIRDNYVILNYLPESKKNIGLGSIVLLVKDGGKCLSGNLIGTALKEMILTSIDNIKLERK